MDADRKRNGRENDSSFISEEIKKRPLSAAQIFKKAGILLLAGLLFGAAARASFEFTGRLGGSSRRRSRYAAESGSSQSAAAAAGSSENSVIQDETSVPPPEAEAVVTGQGTGEPAAEWEFLEHLKELNDFINGIGREVKRSVVSVAAFTDKEDWFRTKHTAEMTASGLIIGKSDSALEILTYREVAESADNILVTFADGTIHAAEYINGDSLIGIAVVSVPLSDLAPETESFCKAAELAGEEEYRPGDYVIAIGSSLGYSDAVEFGDITSANMEISVEDGEYSLIVTNILGSAVGSGVLANLNGQVSGWITRRFEDHEEAVVKAIPLSELRELTENLILGRKMGYAGITGRNVSHDLSEATGIPEGIYVAETGPDSPAVRAGIMRGDVITAVDGEPVTDMEEISELISLSEPGDSMKVTVLREGADRYVTRTFTITIGERN